LYLTPLWYLKEDHRRYKNLRNSIINHNDYERKIKMKRSSLIFCLPVLAAMSLFSQQKDFPKLTGPYLGQRPPGLTPEIFAPGIVSSGSHDLNITISPDLSEIYFTRSGPDWFSAILVSKNSQHGWSKAEPLKFPGSMQSHYPFITPDGKTMYFNAPGTEGSEEAKVWTATYDKGEFGDWKMLEAAVNAGGQAMFPSVSASGTLCFSSIRQDGQGGFDLYKSMRTAEGYGKPENLGPEINSAAHEFHAYIALDESYIIFDSQRPGGFGRNDLYISYRDLQGGWTKALNMGPTINTESGEQRPYVSPDREYLFFSSDRPNPQVAINEKPLTYDEFEKRINGPGNGFQDIYWVSAKIIEELIPKE
jgi:Tol biopolymer transport system component